MSCARLNSSRRFVAKMSSRNFTSARLKGFDAPTVWHEFTPLSNKHKSVNLGQGFPDWESPQFVKEAMVKAVHANFNQYTRSEGDLSLVETLAKHYSAEIGREINPLTEVTVTVGATEALFAVMQALLDPGDEVVVLEPTFDIYPAQVQMAGGVCKYVPLRLNDAKSEWVLDMAELEAAITPKTKLMILNTPHNVRSVHEQPNLGLLFDCLCVCRLTCGCFFSACSPQARSCRPPSWTRCARSC
jgi:aspartate/methionine/tyrosine aminotransferase